MAAFFFKFLVFSFVCIWYLFVLLLVPAIQNL